MPKTFFQSKGLPFSFRANYMMNFYRILLHWFNQMIFLHTLITPQFFHSMLIKSKIKTWLERGWRGVLDFSRRDFHRKTLTSRQKIPSGKISSGFFTDQNNTCVTAFICLELLSDFWPISTPRTFFKKNNNVFLYKRLTPREKLLKRFLKDINGFGDSLKPKFFINN